jgi:septum formation protein
MNRQDHRPDPRRIVLASGSPRRRRLLHQLGFDPVVRPARVDEGRRPQEPVIDYVERLSEWKGAKVVRQDGERLLEDGAWPWVLAADTVVVLDDQLLEKPGSAEQARRMLRELSDRWHEVVTGYHVRSLEADEPRETRSVTARVRFRALADEEIERYVETGEPMDKAGAYGIQGIGGFLVRQLEGSYFTVVGLPICEVIETLRRLGAIERYPFSADDTAREAVR